MILNFLIWSIMELTLLICPPQNKNNYYTTYKVQKNAQSDAKRTSLHYRFCFCIVSKLPMAKYPTNFCAVEDWNWSFCIGFPLSRRAPQLDENMKWNDAIEGPHVFVALKRMLDADADRLSCSKCSWVQPWLLCNLVRGIPLLQFPDNV